MAPRRQYRATDDERVRARHLHQRRADLQHLSAQGQCLARRRCRPGGLGSGGEQDHFREDASPERRLQHLRGHDGARLRLAYREWRQAGVCEWRSACRARGRPVRRATGVCAVLRRGQETAGAERAAAGAPLTAQDDESAVARFREQQQAGHRSCRCPSGTSR